MAKKKIYKKAKEYEKKRAKAHGAKHKGKPGEEDYQRGNVKGEVKFRQSKVTKPELMKYIKKGITWIDSKA